MTASDAQLKTFEGYLATLKACKTPRQIRNTVQLVKDARGLGRITRLQYDMLSRHAAVRLAELRGVTQ